MSDLDGMSPEAAQAAFEDLTEDAYEPRALWPKPEHTFRWRLARPFRRASYEIWRRRWVYEGRLPRWQAIGDWFTKVGDRIDPRPDRGTHFDHVHVSGWDA